MQDYSYSLIVIMILSLLTYSVDGQTINSNISTTIEKLIAAPESGNAQFGISVRYIDGQLDYAYQGDTKLIPASTLKIITTLGALEILGPDYQFQTEIGYSGDLLADGTLIGDILVIGSGDPSLASPEYPGVQTGEALLQRINEVIQGAGIRCVDGFIIVCDGIFDRQLVHSSWSWDDLTNYYASGTRGFNWHENLYFLSFSRSVREDQPTSVASIEPLVPGLMVDNKVRTGPKNSGDNAYIYGDPYRSERVVEGTIPPGNGVFTIKGAIPDPPSVFAQQLINSLSSIGINSLGIKIQKEVKDPLTKSLVIIKSPGLKELVKYANTKSNNLFCEAFMKALGAQVGVGSYKNGQKTIENHLNLIGVDDNGWHQVDGSGLSARNRLTPNFLTAFLAMKSERLGENTIREVLPKVGKDGTVRSLLNGYSAQPHSWLKSGSINHVLAYAGILETLNGNSMAISVIANGHSSNRRVRGQIEKIIQAIYEEL